MGEFALRVEGLGKRYHIGARQPSYQTLRDQIAAAATAPFRRAGRLLRGQASAAADLHEAIWALRDVSFQVGQGEVVGVIGRNGAGKSTLLKILSRITEPSEGYADVRGRVGSLLEVGTGFHPELTGRENTYLNGAILGMRREETAKRFDEIVAFSEIEKFLDTPVKHYSTGMYLRLAFSVAAHLKPAVLLVDEVLAVGDTAFQEKCVGKMKDLNRSGRTVLFVSHNLTAVEALCSKCVLLSAGRVRMFSDTPSVISAYVAEAFAPDSSLRARTDRDGSGSVRLVDVRVHEEGSARDGVARLGREAFIDLHYENHDGKELKNINVVIGLYDSMGHCITFLENRPHATALVADADGGQFRCRVPRLPLTPGKYSLNVTIHRGDELLDWVQQARGFVVEEGSFFGTGQRPHFTSVGRVLIDHSWRNES
jgi:lipopolysaccharide transport system ATP-binding protein